MSEDADYDLEPGPDPATFAAAAAEPPLPAPSVGGAAASARTVQASSAGVADESSAGAADASDPRVVHAVGIGPGNPDFLTPRGRQILADADVVVGFDSVVEYVGDAIDGEALRCGYRTEAETLERFAERVAGGERGAAVLMGDPNHSGYQFLGKVERAIEDVGTDSAVEDVDPDSRIHVRVVPGISSLQVAASRARTPMEATTFATLHRSGSIDDDLARLCDDVGERHLLVLPRPYDWMPERIAAHLLEAGASPELEALVLERLTHEEESIARTTLGELAADAPLTGDASSTGARTSTSGGERPGPEETAFSDLSVLAVRARSR